MTLNEYQAAARETAIYPAAYKVIYPALGLCGEAGEVAEKIKKHIRDDAGSGWSADKRGQVIKELGDVLWYVANLAEDLGVTLEQVAVENVHKLASRAERGTLQGSGDAR